jgi:21S rRNA (uridine2791-2'-O)-methyltransferase
VWCSQLRCGRREAISEAPHTLRETIGLFPIPFLLTQDLCDAALLFAIDTLKVGGSFACKVFTGEEDKFLQQRLKRMFHDVKRRKPEATRKESKELYLVGLKRRKNVTVESVFGA